MRGRAIEKAWQRWYREYEQERVYNMGYRQAVNDIMSCLKVKS
jgi:hypothetical protein